MSAHRAPEQIFIGLDGPAGQVYQVSNSEFTGYWKHLGYKVIGAAAPLPGFDDKPVKQNKTIEMRF